MTAEIPILLAVWLILAVLLAFVFCRLFHNAGKVELQQRRFYDGKWMRP